MSDAMLEKLSMILAWFSQRVRLIETIKGLPALHGTSAHSKKGVKINTKRLRLMYQFYLAAARAALDLEKSRRRTPQRH
jgi:hypothetical protein